jgi:hypothetical protein
MSDTLMLSPVGLQPQLNGSFTFYSGQIIVLSATLTGSDVQDKAPIVLTNIVTQSQGPQAEQIKLVIYPEVQDYLYTANANDYTVSVNSKLIAPGTAVAELSVLVVQGGNDGFVNAYANSHSLSAQQPITFSVARPTVYAPFVRSGVLLRQADDDRIPSNGSFVYAHIAVADSTGTPLPNMRVRLYSGGDYADNITWASKIRIYADYDAQTPDDALQWNDDALLGWGYDAQTNDAGFFDLFICAKKDEPAADTLMFRVGDEIGMLTDFLVIDLEAVGTASLDPPEPPENPLSLDLHPQTFAASVSSYTHVSSGDRIYVLCNAGYQGRLEVNVDNIGSNPLGTVSVSSLIALSQDYDTTAQNKMSGVIASNQQIVYTSALPFLAAGAIRQAVLDAVEGDPNAPAPSIAANPDGLPFNLEMLSGGVCITIPMSGISVQTGDVINLCLCLNGYRGCPHEDEPKGVVLRGPSLWKITPQVIASGCAQWWMQADCFMGMGQKSNGDLGKLEAQYCIFRGSKAIYRSAVLSFPLDTIPPSGYDDGYRDYMGPDLLAVHQTV